MLGIPHAAGLRALTRKSKKPVARTGFLPFLAAQNSADVLCQLVGKHLPTRLLVLFIVRQMYYEICTIKKGKN